MNNIHQKYVLAELINNDKENLPLLVDVTAGGTVYQHSPALDNIGFPDRVEIGKYYQGKNRKYYYSEILEYRQDVLKTELDFESDDAAVINEKFESLYWRPAIIISASALII